MPNATSIIRDILKDAGIEHQYNEKDKKVSLKIGDVCKADIRKYPYGSKYGINTFCSLENNIRLNSVADFVDTIRISRDNKKFELYATSSDETLGAGKIDIIIPIISTKTVSKRSGKYEIDCTHGDGNDCKVSLLHLRDIRDNEEILLEENDKD